MAMYPSSMPPPHHFRPSQATASNGQNYGPYQRPLQGPAQQFQPSFSPPPLYPPGYPAPGISTTPPMTWMPIVRNVQPASVPSTFNPSSGSGLGNSPEFLQHLVEDSVKEAMRDFKPEPSATNPDVAAVDDAVDPLDSKTGTKVVDADDVVLEKTLPKTYAQETGERVGDSVAQFLEANPEWEQRLQDMNVDNLLSDPNSLANEFRANLQQTRLYRMARPALRRFGKVIVGAFPQQQEAEAQQVLDWLLEKAPEEAVARAKANRKNNKYGLLKRLSPFHRKPTPMSFEPSSFAKLGGTGSSTLDLADILGAGAL